jgi:rhomboid-related protein 1/2/3
VSYLAHIWGSLAGITIGLVVLKTFQQKLWERWVWWTALFIYSAFIIAAFVANLIA